MLRRWDGKNANEPFIGAPSDWYLGQKPRWKFQPSRWWDSGLPGRRSKGSIMRCTNKRGYQGPHCMGQSRWRPLIWKSALPWKSGCSGGGVPSGHTWIGGSHCEDFVAQLPDWILSPDLGKEWGLTWPGPQWSQGHWRVLEATHLLEEDIERLSWAASRVKHAKCWHPYSHSCFRGRPQGRHAWSPSPHRTKKHVTFLDKEEKMSSGEGHLRGLWGQVMGGVEVEESGLGPPPTLRPELEHFLETPTTMQGARDR